MKAIAIIPARYDSTRLPGKPLAPIAGEPMIRWVYERAEKAHLVDEVWVATDDERIFRVIQDFGGKVRMTSSTHRSGTDRLAELARDLACDMVVNVQGDEPLINPLMIDEVVACIKEDPGVYMSTLQRKITNGLDLLDPNVVKVVTDTQGFALFFSRAPLPFFRDAWKSPAAIAEGPLPPSAYRHVGLYGYTRDFLLHFSGLSPTPLEKIEQLEQLRVLENGFKIKVKTTNHDSLGVDSPQDLERVRQVVSTKGLTCRIPEPTGWNQ